MPDDKKDSLPFDDATMYRLEKLIDARIASVAVPRGEIEKVIDSRIDIKSTDRWAAFGVDVTTPQGILMHRETLDWARDSKLRAETLGKRVVLYLGAGMTTLGFIGGFVNWLIGYLQRK